MCVLVSALLFGAAHLHHRFDLHSSWASTLVQFAYTGLFGAYSSYLFMRTGTLLAPLSAHVFCNFMGLPDVSALGADHPQRRLAWVAYAVGIAGFASATTFDAVFRPALFMSPLWDENQPELQH